MSETNQEMHLARLEDLSRYTGFTLEVHEALKAGAAALRSQPPKQEPPKQEPELVVLADACAAHASCIPERGIHLNPGKLTRAADILRSLHEYLRLHSAVCPDDPQPAMMRNAIRREITRYLGLGG